MSRNIKQKVGAGGYLQGPAEIDLTSDVLPYQHSSRAHLEEHESNQSGLYKSGTVNMAKSVHQQALSVEAP